MCSVICIAALVFCAVKIFRNETGFGYADAEQYNAGGTTLDAAVENLDIHWTDGKVTIAYHGKDTVEISEKASKPIPEADALRWRLDGGTLYIRYSRPGFFKMHSLKKELTVTLPKNISLDREVTYMRTMNDNLKAKLDAALPGEAHADQTAGDLLIWDPEK